MTSAQAQFEAALTRRVAALKMAGAEPVDCISLCTRRTTACVLQALGEFILTGDGLMESRINATVELLLERARNHNAPEWWRSQPPIVSLGQGDNQRDITEEDLR